MVATRRGVRVCSPTKTNPDQSSDVPATPSTGRTTRSRVKQADSPTRHVLVETSSQLEKSDGAPQASPPTSTLKRCTRASRLHSPEQPCTPVGSTHEGDVSDVESCCSAVSDMEIPKTRTRGRSRQPRTASQDDEEVSEVESCSLAASASKVSRRSTRRKTSAKSPDPAPAESLTEDAKENESCGSAVSESQRVTKSQRKTPRTRSSKTEDSELSDADSCASSVSGASKSTTRRSTRSRKQTCPIPINLDEAPESTRSPATRSRRGRAAGGTAADVSEPPSCDSEGFESGPTYSLMTRRRGRTAPKAMDSDSDVTDVHSPLGSPCSTRSRGTPCSSRTGSGSSNRGVRVTRRSVKDCSIVLEKTPEPAEEDASLNDSRLESTVIAEDADGTLMEEDESQAMEEEEKEGVEETTSVEKGVILIPEDKKEGENNTEEDKSVEKAVIVSPEDNKEKEGVDSAEAETRSMEKAVIVISEGNKEKEGVDSAEAETRSMEKAVIVISEGNKEKEGVDSAEAETTSVEKEVIVSPEDNKEKEGVDSAEAETTSMEKEVIVISEGNSPSGSPSPGCAEEAAVPVTHQQEEPRAEHESSEMEMMQETMPPSEPLKPCQSVTVTVCESEITEEAEGKEEAMEVAAADAHSPQAVDEDAAAAVETGPGKEEEEEEMQVDTDAQQVVDSAEVRVESIQVSQQNHVTVEPEPEQQPKDVVVQSAKIISLLDSSEDEDEEEEEEVSGEEEEEDSGSRAGPSKQSEAAAAAGSMGGLFMIDTRPGQEADELYYKEKPAEEEASKGAEQQEEEDEEFVDEEGDDDDDDEDAEILYSSRNPKLKEFSSRIDPGIKVKELGGLYINFDGSKSKPVSSSLQKLKEKKIQDEVMKKSVMGPDFEKKEAVPPYKESKKALKLKHRVEREKSTGDGWFNMKAPEISQELKGDLQVLKMRGSMDPKRFYKKNDRDGFPKYFQVGTVVDNAVDFYHSRVPKKMRKRTMVEELLSDAEFRQNNKKKYQHIVTEKAAQGAGKRNKKKNKFHKK